MDNHAIKYFNRLTALIITNTIYYIHSESCADLRRGSVAQRCATCCAGFIILKRTRLHDVHHLMQNVLWGMDNSHCQLYCTNSHILIVPQWAFHFVELSLDAWSGQERFSHKKVKKNKKEWEKMSLRAATVEESLP